ncbi:MAG: hypothetical protein JW768_01125 [Chitinispirillaceae bacterium]|nr:hypothetical protein [Chitinispirillaceae bacterium]
MNTGLSLPAAWGSAAGDERHRDVNNDTREGDMLISAALNSTSLHLSEIYKLNQLRINDNMVRVATGKRFQYPSDNIPDYFRVHQLRADIKGHQQVQRELSYGAALLDSAKEVGTIVFEDLIKMQELMKEYYDPGRTDDERTADQIQFNVIRQRISDAIDTAYYDGWELVQDNGSTPLLSIILDPRDISQTYDISYDAGDVTDVSGLTLGIGAQAAEEAALQSQLDRAASYLAKSVVYSDAVASHQNLLSLKNIRYLDSIDNVEKADDGAEIMSLVKKNISQHMTVSMMAQANMFRSGIASLVESK